MLNYYPTYKYIIIVLIIFFGFIYAIPNIFRDDVAIQITGSINHKLNKSNILDINNIIKHKHIVVKSIELNNKQVLLRFYNQDNQLLAYEYLSKKLGNKCVIALNLASTTPFFLKAIGANPMRLGLDLRGGVHFLLKVNSQNLINKIKKQEIFNICDFLKKSKVNFLSFDDKKINFKNNKDLNDAYDLLKLKYKEIYLSKKNKTTLVVKLTNFKIKKIKENAIKQNIYVLKNRLNNLGITEAVVQKQSEYGIIIELPGIQDTTLAKEIIGATATLEFRLVDKSFYFDINKYKEKFKYTEIKNTTDGRLIRLYKKPILSGKHIIDATSGFDEYNQPQVNIYLDKSGGNIMLNFTKNNIGNDIATLFIEYNNKAKTNINNKNTIKKIEKVINVATIKSILDTNFRITGISNFNDSKKLALLLKSGSLVTPINIIEEKIIGPTLGKQNIFKGLISCLLGLISSIIFMIVNYKSFGIISTIALLSNLLLIFGFMSLLPGITLTMPGIAGIILSIAVAIDSNVLINERIKEELRNGRNIQKSINEGYKRALPSILDSNLVSITISIILYKLNNGPISGFAITTIIGILTSIFTSIIGTRAIVNFIYGGKKIKKLNI
ncbi:MAG: protein translocase subunit SecD [Enterobacterales bacterium]